MHSASVLILTDDLEYAGLLTSCWRSERLPPSLTVLESNAFQPLDLHAHDLLVAGLGADGFMNRLLSMASPGAPIIVCAPSEAHQVSQWRARHPRLLHVPFREGWAQTLLLVAGETLRAIEAGRRAGLALTQAVRHERDAVLGRYMLEMKHSLNNALTSILGNAELLLLEPGQLTVQSLQQLKTVHTMALRINEILLRFSSLASEIRGAETTSQPETEAAVADMPARS